MRKLHPCAKPNCLNQTRNRKYCSHNCAASVNNIGRKHSEETLEKMRLIIKQLRNK